MAERRSASGGLSQVDYEWGSVYTGSGAQLVAAGVATFDQLPGASGRPKWAATYYDGQPFFDGARNREGAMKLRILRLGKDRYQACLDAGGRSRRGGPEIDAAARADYTLQQLLAAVAASAVLARIAGAGNCATE